MAHHRFEFVVTNLDEVVACGDLMRGAFVFDARVNGASDGLLFDATEERFGDAEFDVRFEQTQTHFTERCFDVGFGELGKTRESIASLPETSGKRVEHTESLFSTTSRASVDLREGFLLSEPRSGSTPWAR